MATPSDRTEIIAELREVFDRVTDGRLDVSRIGEDAHVINDLGLSSLELLELRFELESVWNVVPDDDQVRRLQTVRDVIELIAARAA